MAFLSIYSKINPEHLLHCIANSLELGNSRTDISAPDQFLQVSVIPLRAGKHITPHIHDLRGPSPGATITQESWVVLRGKIRIRLFDLDRAFLHEDELLPGFLLVTYNGGHSLECLDEDSVMLEFKNGPYIGRDFQTFLDP